MIILRPRQKVLYKKIKEQIQSAKKDFPNKAPKICVQAPCGFGKTPLMVTMINGAVQKGNKVLFLAPRKELVGQCSKMLNSWNVEHGILNNPKKVNSQALVQLSCPLTIAYRKNISWTPDIIFYDECHGSLSARALEVLQRYPNAYVFGFSATPYRDDGKGLEGIYDYLVESCSTNDLINDGLLIKPTYFRCFEEVTTTEAITFNSESEESSTIEADIVIKADIIRNFKEKCANAQTVVFCSSMAKAEEIAEKFRKAGFSANSVDSETPTKIREKLLHDFENKKFQILCNAMLLKEGWDYPDLECVILLRNLKSRVFFRQAAARCMRVPKNNPNKKAFVLDFFNNIDKFGRPWDDEIYSLQGVEPKTPKEIKKEINEKGGWCTQCSAMLDSDKIDKCPYCGYDLEKQKKLVVEAIADLQEVKEDVKIFTKSEKQIKFDALCAKCINKDWNPGRVAWLYKEEFGVFPKGLVKSPAWEKYCNEFNRTKLTRKLNMSNAFENTKFL